ncbi:MAG: PAS domain S-box protein [Rhodothermales bacterium]
MEHLLLNAIGQAVFVVDTRQVISVWNRAAEAVLGWSARAIVGQPLSLVLPDIPGDEFSGLMERGETQTRLRSILAADGTERNVLLTFRPLWRDDGVFAGTAVMVDGDSKYRAIVDTTNEGIWLVDANAKTSFVNARISEMLGYSASELMGRRVSEFIHSEDRSRNESKFSERKRGVKETYDLRFLTKSGDVLWTLVTASPFHDDTGNFAGAIGMLTDISERKQAEDRFQGLVNQLDAIVWEARMDVRTGRTAFTFVSDRVRSLLGYEPEEWVDDAGHWVRAIHEDDRDRVVQSCQLSTSLGQDHALEYRMRTRDGGMIWIRDLVRIVGHSGDETLLTGILVDVTGLHKAKEAAEEVARLKSAILANMSHELRTPLSSIIGFADVLMEETEGELRELASVIRQGGDRLQLTLDSVLALAQLESGALQLEGQSVDVVQLARDLVQLFSRRIAEKGLRVDVVAGAPEIWAHVDEGAVSRILTNLLHNAIKFTDEGHIAVRVGSDEACFQIEVEDTGVGIDAGFLPRIFDEYQQESRGLSRTHEGVGLGLAICQRLVGKMDGSMDVRSTKGEGSTFTVRLPLSVQQPVPEVSLQAG